MTGAPVPSGADAVVMVEYTESVGDRVTVKRSVGPGENVVPAGAEARRDDIMVAKGTRVQHAVVAVAAAVGRPEVAVYRRPQVAVLATGDELVDINLPPGPNEIRNSNSYSLAAQVNEAGGDATILPVARDERDDLALLLAKGLTYDLLLLTGGVSAGKYDLVEEVLASLGAEFFFTGVAIQPGKPVVFGQIACAEQNYSVLRTAGKPGFDHGDVSVIREAHAGRARRREMRASTVRAGEAERVARHQDRTNAFPPGQTNWLAEQPEVERVHWQGSGDLMSIVNSNCYIVVPPDREQLNAGETVTVLLSNSMSKAKHTKSKLSHYDASGRAAMVDVSLKSPTLREAEAQRLLAWVAK